MANTQRMIGPDGSLYDLPVELVHRASRDGFRFQTAGPSAPVPSGLQINGVDRFLSSPTGAALKAIDDTATDITIGTNVGAAKAIGRHVIGAGNVVRQGINKLGANLPAIPTPDILQPQTVGEKIGGGIEGMGEFMIPEAWAGKVGKAGMLAKAGYTGLTNGLVQSIQQGEVNRSSGVAAGLGFGSSLGADAFTAVGRKYLPKLFNKGLVPSRADLANGANPGQAVMDEGIVGNNYQQIADQADALKSQVGRQTDTLLQSPQNLAKRVDLQGSINQIDNLTDLARSQGRTGLADEFANARERFTHQLIANPTNPARSIMVPRGPSTASLTHVSPFEANLLKRGLNDFTTWGSSPSAMEAGNQMQASIYGGLNDAITTQVPEIAGLNSRYQNLRSLAVSAGRRAEFVDRSGRSMLGPLLGSQVGMVGGGLEGYREHGLPGAAIGAGIGLVAGGFSGGMTNPSVVTHSMAALPYVNPFLSTARAAGFSAYNNFNPSDNHGTNPQ